MGAGKGDPRNSRSGALYSSNADANGRTADQMAHHNPRDNSTIIISAAPIGRTVSRWS